MNKTYRKVISLLLILVMIMSLSTVGAFATEDVNGTQHNIVQDTNSEENIPDDITPTQEPTDDTTATPEPVDDTTETPEPEITMPTLEPNAIPTLKEGVPSSVSESVEAGQPYSVNLGEMFEDADEDELTFEVKIGDNDAVSAEVDYSFVAENVGEYILVFTACDGKEASEDKYTVTLTVTATVSTYFFTALIPEGITPQFYVTAGYDENRIDILGDALESIKGETENGFDAYSVKVPQSVDIISVRAEKDGIYIGGISHPVSENETIVFKEAMVRVLSRINNQYVTCDQVRIETEDADGHIVPMGTSGTDENGRAYATFFVAALGNKRLYTFYLIPQGEAEETFFITQANNKTIAGNSASRYLAGLKLNEKKLFKLHVPQDAEAKVFNQNRYFDTDEITAFDITDGENGTKVYSYYIAKGSTTYSYRVSKEGKITKAGYIAGDDSEKTVTWTQEDYAPDAKITYDKTTVMGSRGDDSLLLNINERNSLVLDVNDTFKLRSYRTWEIINNDTQNIIIEPDFTYEIISGSPIISIEPQTSGNGNAKNNWLNIKALAEGTAIVEIGYNAIDIISGNGGLNSLNEFTFSSCSDTRKGLFVVQTANVATDVDFGIKSKDKWDAEFDTLYFMGDSAKLNLEPAVEYGTVAKVEISNDKGQTWTELARNENGYTAEVYAGNNIIKVTKDDSTEAYQIVRGEKITVSVNNLTNPGQAFVAGDTLRIKLDGVHFTMPKIAGAYNPGFSFGHKVTYTLDETQVQTDGVYQYNFPTNAYMDIVVAENEDNMLELTDGYIYFNNMGSAPGGHRNITDAGLPTDFNATSTEYSRCILPDIKVNLQTGEIIEETPDEDNSDNNTDGGNTDSGNADSGNTDSGNADNDNTDNDDTNSGNTGSGNSGSSSTKPNNGPIDTSNLEFDISGKQVEGYVTISFCDYGKRVENETGVTYKNQLGVIIDDVKVPFEEDDTIATVTLRLLKALNIKAHYSGDPLSGFYLSSIGNFDLRGKHYNSFGEFDAGSGSGWMVTQNNWFINMGASEFYVEKGDVIKWQYTCRLGADIGCDWSNPSAEIVGIKFKSNYGTLSPAFNKDVTDYTYTVSASTASICVEVQPANYWSIVTYKADGKTYKPMEKIPVSDGTVITVESAFARYAGDNPTDKDGITITIKKNSGGGSTGGNSSVKDDDKKDDETKPVEPEKEDEVKDKKTFAESTFTDVKKEEWHYESVKYVYENNLMQGTGEGFEPESKMSRAMLVTVLYRLSESESVSANHNFTDVEAGMWYSDAVAWATENNIVSGMSENKFAPDEDITREQMALIIYRYAKMQGVDMTATSNLEGFNDVKDVSDWALDAIKWANSVTLVNGTSETTLSPKDTATRAQVATILMRFCETLAK